MAKINNLRLDLTSYCNQKCEFCPYHGIDKRIEQGNYINIEHYLKVADDLKSANYNPQVRFGGSGERIQSSWGGENRVKWYNHKRPKEQDKLQKTRAKEQTNSKSQITM